MTNDPRFDASPRQCQCCERTALWGTAGHDAAVDPRNCPRCDHSYAVALAGGNPWFDRANDSEFFVAPSTLPAVVEFAPPSPRARRVAIYAAASAPDAPDADVPSLTGRAVAALGVELLDRGSPADADRVAAIVRDECGVAL